MPSGIEDRDADIWEPLLAIADMAGGRWPERARCAGVTLVTATKAASPSLGIRLLADLRTVFSEHADTDHLFTDDIISALIAIEDAPWADIRGKALDSRSLARRLGKYEVKPRTVRIGDRTSKGYARADLFDPWTRYVTDVTVLQRDETEASLIGNVTPVGMAGYGNVTSVTPSQGELAS